MKTNTLQTLAKVICTVLRFSAEQTRKVMAKESKKTVCDLSVYLLVSTAVELAKL